MKIAFEGFRHDHIWALYDMAMQNEKVTIVGSYEEDEETRIQIKEKRNIENTYENYEELLADETVDAVAIGDYYGKRGAMVLAALKSGKHVICDKPICTELEELLEIEALAKERNLQVCCMFELRYMPQVEIVKEMIQSGELGDIKTASFTGQHCLNYGKRPQWYFEEGKHGGTINDIAIHGIDLVRYITGKNLSKVNCAKVWNAFADKEPQFADCGQFMVEMDDMALMADVSYSAPKSKTMLPTYWDFYFWGTKGMLNFRLKEKEVHIFMGTEEILECPDRQPDYLNDFLKAVSGEQSMLCTGDILESQKQTLVIQKAANESR